MKHFIVISGPPGAGKSHLARNLSRQLGILWLDYDNIAEPIISGLLAKRMVTEYYQGAEIFKKGVYTLLMDISCKMLALQDNIIISAPFTNIRVSDAKFFSEYREKLQDNVCIVEIFIKISEQRLQQQIFERNLPRDLDKIENWHNFYKRFNDSAAIWNTDALMQYDMDTMKEQSVIEWVQNILVSG